MLAVHSWLAPRRVTFAPYLLDQRVNFIVEKTARPFAKLHGAEATGPYKIDVKF